VAAISHRIVLPLFVAFGTGPAELFAGTALVARTDACPRSKMSRTWEATHVRADLGDDGRSGHGSGCWQAQQELHGFFLLCNQSANIDLHPMDCPLQVIEVVEQFANQQLVMSLDPSIQRQTQCGQLFAEPSFGQFGQDLRVRLSLLDGLEHASSTHSYDIDFSPLPVCYWPFPARMSDAIDLPFVRSSTRALRYRVRSRRTRIAGGGIKLGRSSPWRVPCRLAIRCLSRPFCGPGLL
jgi:hypothetical protein